MTEMSAAEGVPLADGGVWLLDVREPHEWARGRSPLANHIPLSQLTDRVDELPQDGRILVVCHAGSRSLKATQALRQAGFDAVNITGGMVAWQQAGGALVADGADAPRVD